MDRDLGGITGRMEGWKGGRRVRRVTKGVIFSITWCWPRVTVIFGVFSVFGEEVLMKKFIIRYIWTIITVCSVIFLAVVGFNYLMAENNEKAFQAFNAMLVASLLGAGGAYFLHMQK